MKLFGGGFFFRCRKVLNMRLFPNDKNGKAWDQNVSLSNFPLCNFSRSGPLCFGKSIKDSQFPFWQTEQMEVGSVLQVMQKSYGVLLGKPFYSLQWKLMPSHIFCARIWLFVWRWHLWLLWVHNNVLTFWFALKLACGENGGHNLQFYLGSR